MLSENDSHSVINMYRDLLYRESIRFIKQLFTEIVICMHQHTLSRWFNEADDKHIFEGKIVTVLL